VTEPKELHLIEQENAIYRGFARAWPSERWDIDGQRWVPYTGKVPKDMEWGNYISEEEAKEFMAPWPSRT
jgi:hypothetical protein